MKWWINNPTFTRWIRVIHRDLGFLLIGITCIYGISGIYLNNMNGSDPAFHTVKGELLLESGLNNNELIAKWLHTPELPGAKKVLPADENHLRVLCESGIAVYNIRTGQVEYEIYKKRLLIYWINKLHYNQINGWSPVADFFSVSLIFFALSGLFMVKGKKGIKGSGKWYLLIGLLIPIIYILLI